MANEHKDTGAKFGEGQVSEPLQGPIRERPNGDAPSIRIESAEGIATFPGLNGDLESERAREFINRRLEEIRRPPTEVHPYRAIFAPRSSSTKHFRASSTKSHS